MIAMSMIIETLPAIGREVGRSAQTVKTWQKIHGFPLFRMPNGNWGITRQQIESWCQARANQERGQIDNESTS